MLERGEEKRRRERQQAPERVGMLAWQPRSLVEGVFACVHVSVQPNPIMTDASMWENHWERFGHKKRLWLCVCVCVSDLILGEFVRYSLCTKVRLCPHNNPPFPEAVIMQKYCTLWLLLARNKTHNWFISSTAAFIQCLSVRTQTNGIRFSYRCWPDCLVPCWLWLSLDILHSPSSSLWPTFFLFFLLWWSHVPPFCSFFFLLFSIHVDLFFT